ncbi:FadR/GntR family transcriptional regulator [Actinocatenispora rupis]|uniref:FadR/GntR family transcriptional regulator n=1 Tax=Actinocatenispora rupis TaxID=519421 RepID=UPI0019443E71|nr:FCD domain-containing protein [Actinocatenispora rupis]
MAEYPGRGIHGQTVERLARRILSGQLAEGDTIDIPALEAELDVSRTALREALKVLAAKGLVGARQKRGTFVRTREEWNLLDGDVMRWQFAGPERTWTRFLGDLAEVRGLVEPPAAHLAATRRTTEDVAALDAALDAMAAAGSPADAVAADLGFHRALLAATHNELLARMEVVIERALAERDRIVHEAAAPDPVPVHRAVRDAVAAGDPDAARDAMETLLALADQDAATTTHVRTEKA